MKRSVLIMPLAAVTFVLAASMPAAAASVFFDFNSLAQQSAAGTGSVTLASNASTIQAYMNGVLGLAGTVTVGPGVLADRSYDGEGYVVGPGTTTVVSTTLGSSDGASPTARAGVLCTAGGAGACTGSTDTFLRNDAFGSPTPGNAWSFTFAGWATITSVNFDYELFPDVSGSPDFVLTTNVGTVTGPGTPSGTLLGVAPVSMHSPNHTGTTTNYETAAQLIGNGTWTMTASTGVNMLTFTDWPAAIGIDNLTVNYTPSSTVPEPTSMVLLASGLAGLYARRKKRNA